MDSVTLRPSCAFPLGWIVEPLKSHSQWSLAKSGSTVSLIQPLHGGVAVLGLVKELLGEKPGASGSLKGDLGTDRASSCLSTLFCDFKVFLTAICSEPPGSL